MELVLCGAIALATCACTTTTPAVKWCAAEPTQRDGRAASRVSAESGRLDWANSCIDAFGRYAARSDLRVVITYTPPAAASNDAAQFQSLRDLIDRAPPARYDLKLRARADTRGLTDADGLIVIDLADR
jgi:hypothetical protein